MGRTVFMSLYLLFALFAYYILKPVSRALFINKFDIDKLPVLYILIAGIGGLMAYVYSKIAVRASLQKAVTGATIFIVACLIGIWFLLRTRMEWSLYLFNIWVSLFSILLVSQGWLVAANVFNAREAKRLYGILGVGSVIGAAFGGSFTAWLVKYTGPYNLIFACAFMVVMAYLMFRLVLVQQGVTLAGAKAGTEEEADFSFGDIIEAIRRHRHLQVIISIIVITYVVDVMVEFQFSAMAKEAYRHDPTGKELTAFLGSFYGLWLNLATFILQFFLTAFVVSRFGVGGTLQIMPVTIAIASMISFAKPGVWSTGATRLAEAATRYSFNRTGMELLYLPLPVELKNRTKAFMDIFVDRLARGLGGFLLIALSTQLGLDVQQIALVVLALCLLWMFLSWRAQREYVVTVQHRISARRFDVENARVNVGDPATVRLLVQAAQSGNPRQASYALGLLEEARGFPLEALLRSLISSEHPEIRRKAFDVARARRFSSLLPPALEEIRNATAPAVAQAATSYVLAVAPDTEPLTRELINHPVREVAAAALQTLTRDPERAKQVVTVPWLEAAAQDTNAARRALAAIGVRVRGDEGTEVLSRLLQDSDPAVVREAFQTVAVLEKRTYLEPVIRRLADGRLRGDAIRALAAFGDRICGTLGDLLEDETVDFAIRKQLPRVLRRIPHQRSVDTLMRFIGCQNLDLRAAVLRALNGLREEQPGLDYGPAVVNKHILSEARFYFELYSSLSPFLEHRDRKQTPQGLLVATLEERLKSTVARLFRLLGLKYPPKDIYSAYRAIESGRGDEYSNAIEFLDNVLEKELKRVLLPLLDSTGNAAERAREFFGLERRSAPESIRALLATGDRWLVCCALATAGSLGLRELTTEVREFVQSGPEVGPVAQAASEALA